MSDSREWYVLITLLYCSCLSISSFLITFENSLLQFEHHSWNELPEIQREAALVMGYDKKMWDGDKSPPLEAVDWDGGFVCLRSKKTLV